MDVAVPANQKVAMAQQEIDGQGWSFTSSELQALIKEDDVLLVDLREDSERDKHGFIDSSINIPYTNINDVIAKNGVLSELAGATKKKLVFYCAYGERSAMALNAAREAGLESYHLKGGMAAWSHS